MNRKHNEISAKIINSVIERTHSLRNNPAIPNTLDETEYIVKNVSTRFHQVRNELVRVLKKDDFTFHEISLILYETLKQVRKVELEHTDALIELAKKIAIEETGLETEYVNVNAEFSNSFIDGNNLTNHDVKLDLKSADDVERIKNEVHKRRMTNAIIQGASNVYNKIFFMYKDELNALNPLLVDAYNKIIAISEYVYFVSPNSQVVASGGMCEVLPNDNNTITLNATAVNFVLLIHELIKGAYEILSLNGLPEDENEAKYVLSKADGLHYEIFDTIVGYGIWNQITDKIETNDRYLKHFVFSELVSLDSKEFNKIMNEILLDTENSKTIVGFLVDKVKEYIKEDEFYKKYGEDPNNDESDFSDL